MYYKDSKNCEHCFHPVLWSVNTADCDIREVVTKYQCCWCGLTKEEKTKSQINVDITHGPFLRR